MKDELPININRVQLKVNCSSLNVPQMELGLCGIKNVLETVVKKRIKCF